MLNNYRASHIERVTLNPQHELALFIQLDPARNTSISSNAVVRFGAIANYGEVEAFFSAIQAAPHGAYLAELSRLEQAQKGSWLVDVAGVGAISIRSARCTEQKR